MTPAESPTPERRAGRDLPPADAEIASNRRVDLGASLLAAGFLSVMEMGGAIAKKAFQASDFEVALLTSGQSAGLIASFLIAHLAHRGQKTPLVFWPEALSRLFLMGVIFLKPSASLGFVVLHALSQMCESMATPARISIYRLNYPSRRRGRIVGRIRQLQLVLMALTALALSLVLDWADGEKRLVGILGPSWLPKDVVVYAIPILSALGLAGSCLFFRRIRVREDRAADSDAATLGDTFRRFLRVWREDRDFRRYENFFFLFGFANIMSIPLVQIHAVDRLHADYFDLALINVILVQGIMAATMVFWGRKVDRYTPATLRGFLNMIFAVDFLVLSVAPTIEWVYLGRIFRGIALGGGSLVWMLGSLYYARSQKEAPIYLGIHTVLTGFRWLTAPYAGVLLKRAAGSDARPIFFASFVVVLLAAVWMLAVARREVRRPAVEEEPMPAPRSTGA